MKFVILFLSALSFISAFDIEDYAYHEELLEESSLLLHPRARRAIENKCVHPKSCCPNVIVSHLNSTLMRECFDEVGIDISQILQGRFSNEQLKRIKCLFECIFKKKGYMDANGDLLKDELSSKGRKKIKKRFEQIPWLSPKIDDIFDTCLNNLKPKAKSVDECNDIGRFFSRCIRSEIQLECPLDRQANAEECRSLQAYLKENNDFPPPTIYCKESTKFSIA